MSQFRKLPVLVEAEQWFPDHPVEGVVEEQTQIVFSSDRAWYYIERASDRCSKWLSVATFDEKFETGPLDGGFEIKPTGGETYYRKTKPFQFWKIRSGRKELVSEDSDLFKDYAAAEEWEEGKPPGGRMKTMMGWMDVAAGDWIVIDAAGHKQPISPDEFEKEYEAVE